MLAHISVCLWSSWRSRQQNSACLCSSASQRPAPSLLLSSKMSIPAATWNSLSACSFQVPQKDWGPSSHSLSTQLLVKGVNPAWRSPLSRACRSKLLRRDRQVLQGNWHMRLGMGMTGISSKTVLNSPTVLFNQCKTAVVCNSTYRGKTILVIIILC